MRKSIFTLLLMAFIVPVAMAYVPPKRKHPEVAYEKFKMYHTMLPQVGSLDVSNFDNANRTRWFIGCETLDRDYATFANYKHLLGPLGVGCDEAPPRSARREERAALLRLGEDGEAEGRLRLHLARRAC